jgi:hypothetical protein
MNTFPWLALAAIAGWLLGVCMISGIYDYRLSRGYFEHNGTLYRIEKMEPLK